MRDVSFFESRNGYKAMFHVTQLLETVIKSRIKCSLTFQICLEEWDRSLCRFVPRTASWDGTVPRSDTSLVPGEPTNKHSPL
jgi:hypothetical protein